MAQSMILTGFSGGELSPAMYGRVDIEKYNIGLELCRNFFIDYRGGAIYRPGTKFIAECSSDIDGAVRLVTFTFAQEASYLLEFSDKLIRVYLFGELIDEVVSPWTADEIWDLKFTQSADVMTIDHPSHMPYDLSRTTPLTFTLTQETFGPELATPTGLSATATTGGNLRYGYCVTAINRNGEESLATVPVSVTSVALDPTNASPKTIALEWDQVDGATAYNIYKFGPIPSDQVVPSLLGYIGQTQLARFTDNNIAPDYSRTPPVFRDPFSPGQIISAKVATGGTGYNLFTPCEIGDGGATGYLIADNSGTVVGVVITNAGVNTTTATLDTTGSPGSGASLDIVVDVLDYYPSTVSYFQQRRVHGGPLNAPGLLEFTQISAFTNFDYSAALLDSDAITVSLASREVNQIKHFVPMATGLVVLTTGGAFVVAGGQGPGSPLTPTSISALPQAATGAGDLPPLVVNYNILFQQAKGSTVRDMTFSFETQSYYGTDRSILAGHLFYGHQLTDWAFAEEPHKLVWVVRDDGKALSMTYVPEQEVYAWARHDTDGYFRSIASVPEGEINAIYFVVRRYVNGEWKNYIERLMSDPFDCMQDSWFLDCAVDYHGTPGTTPIEITVVEGGIGGTVTIKGYPMDEPPPSPPNATEVQIFEATTSPGDIVDSGSLGVDWTNGKLFDGLPTESSIRRFDMATFAEDVFEADTQSTGCTCVGSDGTLYTVGSSRSLFKRDPDTLAILDSVSLDPVWWQSMVVLFNSTVSSITYDYALTFDQQGDIHLADAVNMVALNWTGDSITESSNIRITGGAAAGDYAQAFFVARNSGTVGVYRMQVLPPTHTAVLTRLGSFTASSIPGLTVISRINGLCFDESDGNLIIYLTSDTDDKAYLVKASTVNAAVLWSCPVGKTTAGLQNLSQTVIKRGRYYFVKKVDANNSTFYDVDTATGEAEVTALPGLVVFDSDTCQYSNDELGKIVYASDVLLGTTLTKLGDTPDTWNDQWTTFGPPAPDPYDLPGAILVNCGQIEPTSYDGDTELLTGTIVVPFTGALSDDPQNAVIPVAAGAWTEGDKITQILVPHLIGKTVNVVADGFVLGERTVPEDGLVKFGQEVAWAVCGLPYQGQLKTLRLDAGNPTIQGRRKTIPAVTLRVSNTRGLKAGTSFDYTLYEVKDLQVPYDAPGTLFTGDIRINVDAGWDTEGYICIQQDYPLPAMVLALVPEVTFGDNQR